MEKDLKRVVGQRLQLLRIENNLTQEQMSEKLNLSTSAYCKIEYGETDLTLTRLNRIAEIFNIPATDLFDRVNGSSSFNNCQHFVGYAQHNQAVYVGNDADLRELVQATRQVVELLGKRMDYLERIVLEREK